MILVGCSGTEGPRTPPRLLMADGNAAIWGAARQVWPELSNGATTSCWTDYQREQGEAKDPQGCGLRTEPRGREARWLDATGLSESGRVDWERMVAFYDFPRTTGSIYARERGREPVRCGTAQDQRGEIQAVEMHGADLEVALVAEARRLDAPHLLKDVPKFEDGNVSTQQRRLIRLHT